MGDSLDFGPAPEHAQTAIEARADRIAALRASLGHSMAERDRLRALHTALVAELRQAVAQVVAERDRARAACEAILAVQGPVPGEFHLQKLIRALNLARAALAPLASAGADDRAEERRQAWP